MSSALISASPRCYRFRTHEKCLRLEREDEIAERPPIRAQVDVGQVEQDREQGSSGTAIDIDLIGKEQTRNIGDLFLPLVHPLVPSVDQHQTIHLSMCG